MPELRAPRQCHLWIEEEPQVDPQALEVVRTFQDESHFVRRLLRCGECGQLYFYEFVEIVDWTQGNDAQYRTYVPVEQNEVEELSKTTALELLRYTPRIQRDWPKTAAQPVSRWVRKDS
jgi:hypothetical protein